MSLLSAISSDSFFIAKKLTLYPTPESAPTKMTTYKIANIHFEDSYCEEMEEMEEIQSETPPQEVDLQESVILDESTIFPEDYEDLFYIYRKEDEERQEAEWARQLEEALKLEEEQEMMMLQEMILQSNKEEEKRMFPSLTLANPAWDGVIARSEARRIAMSLNH